MKVVKGLFSGMVMQRDAKGGSCQIFSGICQNTGTVSVAVIKAGKMLKNWQAKIVGQAAKGVFNGVLSGIPTGGPYQITLAIGTEKLKLRDLYVGDLWMLGGQSNMEGVGNLIDAPRPIKEVRAFYLDNHWAAARDPLHRFDIALAEIHQKLNPGWKPNPGKGVGPAVAFGQAMFKTTGVPQGVIASAHGGTTMVQWSPTLKKLGNGSLYGAMLERFKLNGGRIAGLLWYQGCADAIVDAAPLYTKRMTEFIKAVRKDFHQPDLPVAIVQIGRLTDQCEAMIDRLWMSIREQQRLLPKRLKNLTCVPVIDLDTDDPIHLSGKDQIVLGRRLAEAMRSLRKERGALPPPIELDSVQSVMLPNGIAAVEVKFKNVIGTLQSAGRPVGFASTRSINEIFKCIPSGNKVVIPLWTSMFIGDELKKRLRSEQGLCYGYGTNPYCNIVDSAGRSLPAFGPLQTGASSLTDYARNMEVSDPVFVKESMDHLVAPSSQNGLIFHRAPSTDYYVTPSDRIKYADPKEKIRYFRTAYNCPEEMDVALLIGYDGPVILYDNDREIFRDPNGANPIIAAGKVVKQHWPNGRHELVFALALNHGSAWGVSLRIERCNVKRTAAAGKTVLLPVEID